jgi:hypothetical protein
VKWIQYSLEIDFVSNYLCNVRFFKSTFFADAVRHHSLATMLWKKNCDCRENERCGKDDCNSVVLRCNVDFENVDCQNVNFWNVDCQNVSFWNVDCQNVNCQNVNWIMIMSTLFDRLQTASRRV